MGCRVRNRTKIGLQVSRNLLTAGVNVPGIRLSLESVADVAKITNDHTLSGLLASFK